MKYETYKKLAPAALGKVKADTIFKNCRIVDVFTGEVVDGNIGIKDGIILGVSRSMQGGYTVVEDGKVFETLPLSFMALTVIPELRITPRGLYLAKIEKKGFIFRA